MDANRRILLIDDTPAIHDDFRKILADRGGGADLDEMEAALFGAKPLRSGLCFELESAYQGEEGLSMLKESLEAGRPFAMAFVDMRMPPGWDGVETIEHLWKLDPRLQVVICTAYSDYSWGEVLDRLEVSDRLLILKKPFDAIEVCQLATTLTGKWNVARQAELKMAALEEAVRWRTLELAQANEALRRDITERRRAEQEASDAYRRISDILEFLPDATFVVDAHGKVIAWNAAIEAMTGVRKEEILDRGNYAYAVPFYKVRRKVLIDMLDEPEEIRERFYPGVKGEGKTLIAEARVMVRDELRHLWSAATPLYDSEGAKIGGIQSLRDVTELRRNEQERWRLEASLHHAGMLESLMAQLGHDLKTPLTPLFALLPLAIRKSGDPEVQRMLAICQESVTQIQGLSGKALDLVRLSSREQALEAVPVSLGAAVDAAIAPHTQYLSQRGISCLNRVSAALLVEASPDQLRLLLDNLLSNAARYAAEGGTVEIEAAVEGSIVTVSVRDDGVGLKPEQIVQIFAEFYKGDTARHDLNTQGLGLAICKRIILNHKGRIWAESEGLGKGTAIHFTLNRAKAA